MSAVKFNFLCFCILFIAFYALTIGDNVYTQSIKCSWNNLTLRNDLTINICWKNNHWYLHKSFSTWKFTQDQMLLNYFPIDKIRQNYVRQVPNAVFSIVYPTPLTNTPKLAAVSSPVLENLLDLDPSMVSTAEFLQFVSGNTVLLGTTPLAHRYGGHQFGYWADQLGDGRAVMLGQYVNSRGERWELQLKGSGLTPYSRRADGRAVIRSSVREFLCSEAMHALGIPTSRAASLVVSSDPVIRDQFYNGNVKRERAAVVLRLAKSWFRIGSLEILSKKNEIHNLRNLTDFIITNYFPSINKTDPDRLLAFFQEVVTQTAQMIAQWQSVGFTHGVCNTDNFSILSITIDYGPFGFMEKYNPKFVPNTSDDEGRYSYGKQPDVGIFNLNKLKEALHPLMDREQKRAAEWILKGYAEIYKSKFMELFQRKLGFSELSKIGDEDFEQFVAILLKIMTDTQADFTMTLRELSEINLHKLLENIPNHTFPSKYWTLPILSNHEWFVDWVKLYKTYLKEEQISEHDRQILMKKVNPRYILRNWIAQVAIEKAEKDDFSVIDDVLKVLQSPYEYSELAEYEGFASKPPKWSKSLKVSCSS